MGRLAGALSLVAFTGACFTAAVVAPVATLVWIGLAVIVAVPFCLAARANG